MANESYLLLLVIFWVTIATNRWLYCQN